MKSFFGRMGAVILLLQAVGHTLGGVVLYRAHTPEEAAVIRQMQGYLLPAIEGAVRTLWDFYYGWGLAVGVLNLGFAVQAWLLSRQVRSGIFMGSGLWFVLAAVSWAQAYLAWRYFFPLPVVLTTAAGICFVVQGWHLRAASGGLVNA